MQPLCHWWLLGINEGFIANMCWLFFQEHINSTNFGYFRGTFEQFLKMTVLVWRITPNAVVRTELSDVLKVNSYKKLIQLLSNRTTVLSSVNRSGLRAVFGRLNQLVWQLAFRKGWVFIRFSCIWSLLWGKYDQFYSYIYHLKTHRRKK